MTADSHDLTADEEARLSVLLLDLWEDLEAVATYARGGRRPENLRPAPEWATKATVGLAGEGPRDVLARWANVFQDELAIVRAARNSVAHSIPLPADTLRSSVYAAGKLLAFARLSAMQPGASEGDVKIEDPRIAAALSLSNSNGQ